MNASLSEAQERMKAAMLTPQEQCLMSMLFGERLTEEVLHILIDGLNLDTANQNYLLMLSCLGHMQGWEFFPPEMIPRLKGIHRYHQVHNAIGIPWLVQQLRKLTDAGIPVMLLKGCAMLAYYAPGTPRLMWDYDVAVPEPQFNHALRLLLAEGNTRGAEVAHSISIKGPRDEIDLHRWIFKTNGECYSDIWERATPIHFHGIDVRVLSPEDMFIHLLDTQSRAHFCHEGVERRLQWLCDCRCIWQREGFDLSSLAARAEEFYAKERVGLMLELFMYHFPELVEQTKFQQFFPQTPDRKRLLIYGEKYQKLHVKYRHFSYTRQSALSPIHIYRSLQLEFANYRYLGPEMRRMDPKLNFLRFFNKLHYVDSFSTFARKYLSRIRLREQQLPGGE